jgi:NAD(P)H-flavin reductase
MIEPEPVNEFIFQGLQLFFKKNGIFVRLPYINVKLLKGSVSSVVLIMERTGVMPLPAAKAT